MNSQQNRMQKLSALVDKTGQENMDVLELRREFDALLLSFPDSVDVRLEYSKFLISKNLHGRAYKLLEGLYSANPDHFEVLFYLGVCFESLGKTTEAIGAWGKAVEVNPESAVCQANLGILLSQETMHAKALPYLQKAIELAPQYLPALHRLVEVYSKLGRVDDAVAEQLKLIRLEESTANYTRLANLFVEKGQYERARKILIEVSNAHPDDPIILNALGGIYYKSANLEKARECFGRAADLAPGFVSAIGNYLLCLNYSTLPAEFIFNEHARFGLAMGESGDLTGMKEEGGLSGKIRVGMLSPDFYQHPVGQIIEPVLHELTDHPDLDVRLYYVARHRDSLTEGLIDRYGSRFEHCANLSDELLIKKIRADQIDVLFDLAGYTADNRMAVFAKRSAPIQVTYLGYPNTTGVLAMDYRIVDEISDPAPQADALASEKLMRVPAPFLNVTRSRDLVEVNTLPALSDKRFVFGCFNNLAKLSDATLEVWSKVLQVVPDSMLLLKAASFSEPEIKTSQIARFKNFGIDPERVQMHARMAFSDHLRLYNRVDLCLDPFPFNGTATTIEALWMGLPFVTLAGHTHVSRVGTSLAAALNLHSFIAETPEDYVSICRHWSENRNELNEIRIGMRERIENSGVSNPKLTAEKLVNAIKSMVELEQGK